MVSDSRALAVVPRTPFAGANDDALRQSRGSLTLSPSASDWHPTKESERNCIKRGIRPRQVMLSQYSYIDINVPLRPVPRADGNVR